MVLCEDDERRFGGGFLFCVEDFVGGLGGVCGRGKALSLGARGCGSWFFRDRAGFRTGIFLTRLRVKKHRMFIRCEIVQEQLLTSELDGAVSARFRAVLNF